MCLFGGCPGGVRGAPPPGRPGGPPGQPPGHVSGGAPRTPPGHRAPPPDKAYLDFCGRGCRSARRFFPRLSLFLKHFVLLVCVCFSARSAPISIPHGTVFSYLRLCVFPETPNVSLGMNPCYIRRSRSVSCARRHRFRFAHRRWRRKVNLHGHWPNRFLHTLLKWSEVLLQNLLRFTMLAGSALRFFSGSVVSSGNFVCAEGFGRNMKIRP